LRFFTTTDDTPEEIHQLGLREVDRIQREILTILEAEGRNIDDGFEAAITALAEDPQFYYEDSDAGREQILADYQRIIDEVSAGLDDFFDLQPAAGVEVQRVPEFKEKTSAGAYYQPPSLDGSRPGVFYANLRDVSEIPKFGMRTLAYHEGVPGHHFQNAITQQLEGLPMFRGWCRSRPMARAGRCTPSSWPGKSASRTTRWTTSGGSRPRCSAPCGWSSIPACMRSGGRARRPSPT
jgi:uncharacterized protein (DUF885 family)